jgi:hypothetical protein
MPKFRPVACSADVFFKEKISKFWLIFQANV